MATIYRMRVDGHLDQRWSDWFDGLTIIHNADGNTSLVGAICDQAALYGLIDKARDLGLTLLAVERLAPGVAEKDAALDGDAQGKPAARLEHTTALDLQRETRKEHI